MGIGMLLIVPERECQEILERLNVLEEKAYLIGAIEKKEANQPTVCFIDS